MQSKQNRNRTTSNCTMVDTTFLLEMSEAIHFDMQYVKEMIHLLWLSSLQTLRFLYNRNFAQLQYHHAPPALVLHRYYITLTRSTGKCTLLNVADVSPSVKIADCKFHHGKDSNKATLILDNDHPPFNGFTVATFIAAVTSISLDS